MMAYNEDNDDDGHTDEWNESLLLVSELLLPRAETARPGERAPGQEMLCPDYYDGDHDDHDDAVQSLLELICSIVLVGSRSRGNDGNNQQKDPTADFDLFLLYHMFSK